MNLSSEEMMAAVYAYNVLTNVISSTAYIARYADSPRQRRIEAGPDGSGVSDVKHPGGGGCSPQRPFAALMQAVEKGPGGEAAARTHTLLDENEPLTLVDEALIPALDVVGEKYEKGKLFLPQLLQAASAAQAAFEEIKTAIAKRAGPGPARAASSSPPSRAMSTTSARTSSASSSRTTASRSSTLAAMCRWRRWWTLSGRRMSTSWGSRP